MEIVSISAFPLRHGPDSFQLPKDVLPCSISYRTRDPKLQSVRLPTTSGAVGFPLPGLNTLVGSSCQVSAGDQESARNAAYAPTAGLCFQSNRDEQPGSNETYTVIRYQRSSSVRVLKICLAGTKEGDVRLDGSIQTLLGITIDLHALARHHQVDRRGVHQPNNGVSELS